MAVSASQNSSAAHLWSNVITIIVEILPQSMEFFTYQCTSWRPSVLQTALAPRMWMSNLFSCGYPGSPAQAISPRRLTLADRKVWMINTIGFGHVFKSSSCNKRIHQLLKRLFKVLKDKIVLVYMTLDKRHNGIGYKFCFFSTYKSATIFQSHGGTWVHGLKQFKIIILWKQINISF